MMNRRRFLAISAAILPAATLLPQQALAAPLHVETGVAMGASVTLRLAHPDAPALAARAMAEIARLEDVFSLYRPDSALVRLNRDARLDAPAPELLECLSLAGAVHQASGGLFDPTVQPLWAAHALALAEGRPLTAAERAGAMAATGWGGVSAGPDAIRLRPGMALTLNGIAQGLVADRVAALLAAEGLDNILIDTGEMRALSGQPGGGGWPVRLASGGRTLLSDRALATSAPLGMTFGGDGVTSHILNPATGAPVTPRWQSVSIAAPRAALADALSTAACLMPDAGAVRALCAAFPGAEPLAIVPA